jgi:hypothetical protein
MPLQVMWDDEAKTIIRSEGVGEWTWEEFHEGLQKVVQMMKTVNHRVDLIIHNRPDSHSPKGSGMPHFQRAIRIMPPNVGCTVFVNTNTFARAIISIFTTVYKNKASAHFVMAATLEDARELILEDRNELVHV